MLECLDSAPFQPNDTYLALSSSFHIITGALVGWEAGDRTACADTPDTEGSHAWRCHEQLTIK